MIVSDRVEAGLTPRIDDDTAAHAAIGHRCDGCLTPFTVESWSLKMTIHLGRFRRLFCPSCAVAIHLACG